MIGFNNFNYIWIAIAIVTFLTLISFNIKAPYGRHSNNKWGAMISNKWGWFLMELPAFILMPALSLSGPSPKNNLTFLLIILWFIHYGFRTLIFPFKLKTNKKEFIYFLVYTCILKCNNPPITESPTPDKITYCHHNCQLDTYFSFCNASASKCNYQKCSEQKIPLA